MHDIFFHNAKNEFSITFPKFYSQGNSINKCNFTIVLLSMVKMFGHNSFFTLFFYLMWWMNIDDALLHSTWHMMTLYPWHYLLPHLWVHIKFIVWWEHAIHIYFISTIFTWVLFIKVLLHLRPYFCQLVDSWVLTSKFPCFEILAW